jgi:hypothetical protein
MTNEDRLKALEKIAGYNGWAGSNRISHDKAQDIIAAHGQSLRGQQKALLDEAENQQAIGAIGMGLGAGAGGYAAKGLVGLAKPPAGVGRMRIAGKAGLAGLVSAGLLYGGKKIYDKHHATKAEAAQIGEEAEGTENYVNYFNGIKGKLR